MNIKEELEEIKKKFQAKKIENIEINNLKEKLEEVRRSVENLYSRVENTPIKIKELEEEIIKIKNLDISRLEKKYEKLEEFSDKLNESIKQTQNLLVEVNKLKNELKNINEIKEFLSNKLRSLENLEEDLTKKLDKIEKKEIKSLEEKIKNVDNKLNFLNINELEKKFNWLENILLQQEKELKETFEKIKSYEDFEKNLEKLKEDLKTLKEYSERVIKPYLDEFYNLSSKIESVLTLENKYSQLKEKLEEISKKVEGFSKLEEILSQKEKINIELNKFKDSVKRLEEMKTVKEKDFLDKINTLNKEVENIKKFIESFEDKTNSILAFIKEVKSESIPEFNKIIEELKHNFSNMYSEHNKLNQKIGEIEEKIKLLSSQLNSMKDKENVEIKKFFDNFEQKISNLSKISSDYEAVLKEITEIKSKTEILEKTSKVEDVKKHFDEKIEQKLNFLESKIDKINTIEKEIESMKEKIEEIRRNVEVDIRNFSFEIWKARKILNDLEKNIEDLSNSRFSLEFIQKELEALKGIQEKHEKYYYSIVGILEEILDKIKDKQEKTKIVVR